MGRSSSTMGILRGMDMEKGKGGKRMVYRKRWSAILCFCGI
ncbi:hypothetical protein HMPREF1987_02015 [Peptostreptococcaceae bacterium oral taxon 113 str. W5053]|nr:hypothetical protein HMPREF1987_02015 [Peptostreptococcaceae bacterium oral taxon 113 str. W5053]